MSANAEIIAELRRVLNERDEARAALAACPDCAMWAERSARWHDDVQRAERERDELVAQRARMAEQIETLDRNAETFLADYGRVRRERDEAVARCETLRELADVAALEQGLAQRRMMEAQRDRDEARAEVQEYREQLRKLPDANRVASQDAFRRGAEAMRLACQQWCRAWENDGEAIADALADLRVEDKP